MNPVYPNAPLSAEDVPLQGTPQHMYPGQLHTTTAAGGHNTIVLQAEPPKDHIIWSLCCFLYSNPLCLGLAVFKRDLNTGRDPASLSSSGRLFQSVGALTANALSPLLFSIDCGIVKRLFAEDLRLRPGTYGMRRSAIYLGASPPTALKAIIKILKSILKRTGSQCKDAKTGVMWSLILVPVKSLAAAFWTNWS
uniref:Uncharacterized protein n=1 Tax=Oryzias sinensis TaxID=183150 RepID=A0A8C7XU96_9TELE